MNSKKKITQNSYELYKILYDKSLKDAQSHDLPFNWNSKFSKVQFETRFQAYKNNDPKLSNYEIVNSIVDEQRFYHSVAQGKAIKRAAKEKGIFISLEEARSWSPENLEFGKAPPKVGEFWRIVKNRQNQLRKEGKTSSQIAKLIAVEFFGSPD